MIQEEEYIFIERIWVIQALFTFATFCLKEECRRRVEAINALTALCHLQEVRRPRHSKSSALDIKLKQDIKPLSVFDLSGLSNSISIDMKLHNASSVLAGKNYWQWHVWNSYFFPSCGNLKKYFYHNISPIANQ